MDYISYNKRFFYLIKIIYTPLIRNVPLELIPNRVKWFSETLRRNLKEITVSQETSIDNSTWIFQEDMVKFGTSSHAKRSDYGQAIASGRRRDSIARTVSARGR